MGLRCWRCGSFWFLILCLGAALLPLVDGVTRQEVIANDVSFPGWPETFEGKPLTRLPLSPLETAFQKDFPGQLARFTDGRREIIFRWVTQKTRKLHPSSDCFKASGYGITPLPLEIRDGEQWSRFTANRGGQKLVVSERIHAGNGGQWSDFSTWYWDSQGGDSQGGEKGAGSAAEADKHQGPWWAVTVAEPA